MNVRPIGIPAAAVEFFQELESNNNKAWWTNNKIRYEFHVRDPFVALLGELGAKYQPWRVYRPHRDTRFAKDKVPYKDFIGAVTQLPTGNGFFVQFSAKGLLLGSGYPMMAPDQLLTYRNAIDNDRTGAAFVALLDTEQSRTESGSEVRIFGGRYEPLKRNPKGFAADHPRGEWLRWKGVEVSQRVGNPKWLSTSSAAEKIGVLMNNGMAMTDWLDKLVGPSALTPEEIWGR
jgi:uncharacterized protein (TIGR02453 family)